MDASSLPTTFLTSTGEFIGEDTDQTSQHDISEDDLERNENTRQGIVRNNVPESQSCKRDNTEVKGFPKG